MLRWHRNSWSLTLLMPPKKVTSDDKGCNVPEVDFLFAICMIFVIVASASGCEDIRLPSHGSEAAEGRMNILGFRYTNGLL